MNAHDHDLRLGDCLDPVSGLASLPDKSVDHVICDPPYSAKVHKASRRGKMGGEVGGWARNVDLSFEHLSADTRASIASEAARLCRRWALFFCDAESGHLWIEDLISAGLNHVRFAAWVKLDGTPQFTGDRPGTGFEAIIIAHAKHEGRFRWNGGGKHGLWSIPVVIGGDAAGPRVHTTQKPLALMEALVRDFTDPGELVCDPFAGSGTTGVACKRLGRRFIGWERDPKFHAAAVKRLDATREQLGLLQRQPKPKQIKIGGME